MVVATVDIWAKWIIDALSLAYNKWENSWLTVWILFMYMNVYETEGGLVLISEEHPFLFLL